MPTTRRGSPEAIAKRKAARSLNALFTATAPSAGLDGRTQKRKERLIKELKDGRNGEALKALDVLMHAHELMKLGETLTSLRRLKPKVPATPMLSEDTGSLILEAQKLYEFNPDAWKLLGVNLANLEGGEEKAAEKAEAKPAPRRKKTAKKTATKKTAAKKKKKTTRRSRTASSR